jgi:hypothetical protein
MTSGQPDRAAPGIVYIDLARIVPMWHSPHGP